MSPRVGQEAVLTWQRPYPVRSPAATSGCSWSWRNAFLTMTKSVDLEHRTPKFSVSTATVRQSFRVEHLWRTKYLTENVLLAIFETALHGLLILQLANYCDEPKLFSWKCSWTLSTGSPFWSAAYFCNCCLYPGCSWSSIMWLAKERNEENDW